jgi:transcriptional regulator with XRE-family HTH domain
MTISIAAQQITGAQIKEARKLLDWTQQRLAENSDVSLLTVKRVEAGKAGKGSIDKTADALRSAGIEFVSADRVGGVKLTRPEPAIVNRTDAAEAEREPMYPSRRRRRRKLDPDKLGDWARRKVRDEARSSLYKIQLCHGAGKLDDHSAERMRDCARRVFSFAESINTNVLLEREPLPCAHEQLFLADLVELRSHVKLLNRLISHK